MFINLQEYLTVRNGWYTTGKNKNKLKTWLSVKEGMILGLNTNIRGWKKSELTFTAQIAKEALQIAVNLGNKPDWNRLNIKEHLNAM